MLVLNWIVKGAVSTSSSQHQLLCQRLTQSRRQLMRGRVKYREGAIGDDHINSIYLKYNHLIICQHHLSLIFTLWRKGNWQMLFFKCGRAGIRSAVLWVGDGSSNHRATSRSFWLGRPEHLFYFFLRSGATIENSHKWYQEWGGRKVRSVWGECSRGQLGVNEKASWQVLCGEILPP